MPPPRWHDYPVDRVNSFSIRTDILVVTFADGEVVRAGLILKYFAGAVLQPSGHVLDSVRPGMERVSGYAYYSWRPVAALTLNMPSLSGAGWSTVQSCA